ncbi:MAG: MbtH family NRPS accessory protein [Gammaproteobacteria bacterium]|nr:MbtH family NRPS accessory protein [Gammaproteobacteria bacterium]
MSDADKLYSVVMNEQQQYSIWPNDLGLPSGWEIVVKATSKQECLEYIEKVWTDLRPLSVRNSAAKIQA